MTPVLKDLHWLPVEQRIKYKIALIMHKVIQHQQPQYLSKLTVKYECARQLQSTNVPVNSNHQINLDSPSQQ